MAFENSALLLIDLQVTWSRGKAVTSSFPGLNDNIRELVRLGRANNMKIIHVYADYNSDNTSWFNNDNTGDVSISLKINKPDLDIVKPMDGEKIIYKPTWDVFYKTTLDEYLKSQNIKNLYFAGLVTSICVLFSVHGGYKRGYKLFVIDDCCADTKKEFHEWTINRFGSRGMFKVVNVKDNLLVSKL